MHCSKGSFFILLFFDFHSAKATKKYVTDFAA